jgi:Raf kinase inhibitor-like YbhB/YbcL family protein
LPADARGLVEAIPPKKILDNGAKQGVNDFRRVGYGGPCPPPGPAHRYMFTLFALNSTVDQEPGLTKQELVHAIRGHVLAEARLVGIYKR